MASASITISSELTPADVLVLKNLASDIDRQNSTVSGSLDRPTLPSHQNPFTSPDPSEPTQRRKETDKAHSGCHGDGDADDLATLKGLNDPTSQYFEPTIISSVDLRDLASRFHPSVYQYVLMPYVAWAKKVARYETDVVMVTHLVIYFATSVPSALWLFYRFTYFHAVLHLVMQGYYMGAYTLLRHQHIHQRGVLAKDRPLVQVFDQLFPYVSDPLMGHTWNSYYYHHVKHHHVEGNGPDDLSSTVRYQRDNIWHFLHYVGRFYLLIWLDLPIYFLRKGRPVTGLKTASWELFNYFVILTLLRVNSKPTVFVFLIPLMAMRVMLMVGNWGQHAFVDAEEPDSDYRSSITLIDVPSNRYCYNDGYHTSHHLNPLRHWRDHPVHFLQHKEIYASEHALVFHNIDYLMITVKLMQHDYEHLARCLVPIGAQIDMTMKERVQMLKRHTRRFTEEEIREKFGMGKGK
ncbi:fatty acid desaturase [Xylariomycetidae sp. FL2044]|nr:fatty acid desaturase [Xylariomycetidae sp. FL2044]